MDVSALQTIAGLRWGVVYPPAGSAVPTDARVARLAGERLDTLGQHLGRLTETTTDADLQFQKGCVLIRKRSAGSVVLICDRDVDTGAVAVALEELERVNSPSDPALQSINVSQALAVRDDEATVPEATVSRLLTEYTDHLGPLARAVAKKQAGKIGVDLARIGVSRWTEVVSALAGTIPSDEKRERFLSAVQDLDTSEGS